MPESFAEKLRRLRAEKGITQQQLASMMYIDRSSIARWENGLRVPDLVLLQRLAHCLGVEVSLLVPDEDLSRDTLTVIIVDDEPPILAGGLETLCRAMPGAEITGFTKPREALEFALNNRIDLAFLDIEMGKTSGFDLCEKLLAVNPATNVVYLTAFPNYALNTWKTGAKGFMVKPLTLEPIVENAVKHGMDPDLDTLHILIRTRAAGNGHEITVINNGAALDLAESDGEGVGLKNVSDRLARMCGGTLRITPRDGGGAMVTLWIPQGEGTPKGQ